MTPPASNNGASRLLGACAAIALILAVAAWGAGCGRKARPEPRFTSADSLKQTT